MLNQKMKLSILIFTSMTIIILVLFSSAPNDISITVDNKQTGANEYLQSTINLSDLSSPEKQFKSLESSSYSDELQFTSEETITTNDFSTNGFIFPWAPESISNNSLENHQPSILIDNDNNIHVFWHAVPAGESRSAIFYSKKVGLTWQEAVPLIANPSFSDENPKAAIDTDGIIHLVWHRHNLTVDGQIWYSNSLNWSRMELVRAPRSANDQADNPDIVADDYGAVHVVWDEESYGKYDVYYASSDENWENVRPIPSQTGYQRSPVIKWSAVDNTTRVGYLRDFDGGIFPAVTWIYKDGSADYDISVPNIDNGTWNAGVGYDTKFGQDCLFWLDEGENCHMAINNAGNPENWQIIAVPDSTTAPTNLNELELHVLSTDTLFVAWRYYRGGLLSGKTITVSVCKDESWESVEDLRTEEEYEYKELRTAKDRDGNVHLVFVIAPKTNSSQSEIHYMFLGVDSAIPTVEITYPQSYSFVKGVVNVTANVKDASGISQVEFYLKIGTTFIQQFIDYNAPYIWTWDTTVGGELVRDIKVKAWDTNGQWNETTARVYVDNTPPTFLNLFKTPGIVYDNTTVIIMCDIQDNDQVANATLYYRFTDEENWNITEMEYSYGLHYEKEIDMTVGGKTIEYFVTASDRIGNVKNSSIEEFEVVWHDSDFDGLGDNLETNYGCDPHDSDSDDDGLEDGEEVFEYGTNPLVADSDSDGYTDGEEVKKGSNPLDSNSVPPSWFVRHFKPLLIFSIIIGSLIIIFSVLYLLLSLNVIDREKLTAKTAPARQRWTAFWAQVWRGAKRTFGKDTKAQVKETKQSAKLTAKIATDKLTIQEREEKFDELIRDVDVLTLSFLTRKLGLEGDELEDFLIEMKKKGKPIGIDLEKKKIMVIKPADTSLEEKSEVEVETETEEAEEPDENQE